MTRRNRCGPPEIDFVYRTFSDIPNDKIALHIRSLVDRGWLQADRSGTQLYLTDRGRSEIHSHIPARLLSSCNKASGCKP